ncbi:MAG: T9SS type A sorting domain-containing protein [Saprospiraceae bacterium]|nr:T9SS type A sorting domain-containing protein [Saprospiraceae bacterium]
MKMEIFPNPTTLGEFYIKINTNDLKHLEIFNTLGEIVYTGYFRSKTRIEASNWIPGIYFIKCDQMSGSLILN